MNVVRKKWSIEDVYITDELAKRAPKKADYLQEKLALQDLAGRMADQPENVLPRFVDLAMEMTGGVSAGLSLYEPNPEPGVFRWRYLRGLLSPFENATTPRNFSPCGITLDSNGPVLSLHPERVYNWISDAAIVVPEVLLVPLYIGSKGPLGTLWIVAPTEGHFDSSHARVMTELASFVGIAVQMLQSEQRLKHALEQQETLAREMNHRVKNMFAITDGMIRVSARAASTPGEMATLLSGRLHAMATAHSLVRRKIEDETPSQGADLDTLVRTILKPYESALGERFRIVGPPMRLGDRATNGVALVCHELATNAAKYGALTEDQGAVDVSWSRAGDDLVMTWRERGGPPVTAEPMKKGFGSTLTRSTVVDQLGGKLEYLWEPEGLSVEISIPVQKLSA
jgi:two-component sensor histidine kinase